MVSSLYRRPARQLENNTMSFTSWIRSLTSRLVPTGRAKARRRRGHGPTHRLRPRLEALEDRLVPATLTVNSLVDTVSGTAATLDLNEAILLINSGGTATDASGNSL